MLTSTKPTSCSIRRRRAMSLAESLVSNPPMRGGATELNVFDIFNQAAFTDLVRRQLQIAWEQVPAMGDQIAPLVPVYDRTIKREVAQVAAFGMAQFRAPDATPKLYAPQIQYTEEVTELLLIDEMQRITEDLYLRLTSPTDAIRARAGVDLVTSGKVLQLRNENRTEWMRWQAFKGNPIAVVYDAGQVLTISYNYTSGHKPVAAVPWTDRANSTPIDDLRAWQFQVAQDIGMYGSRIHMNTNTYTFLQRSNQARGYLSPTDRNIMLPRVDDIENLLYGATPSDSNGGKIASAPKIIVTDAGFRDEAAGFNRGASAMTKYLLDGEVLVTTDYVFEGEPIADVADGMVGVAQDYNRLAFLQGPQSEVRLKEYTYFFRQASARFVRLRRPECFLLGRAF